MGVLIHKRIIEINNKFTILIRIYIIRFIWSLYTFFVNFIFLIEIDGLTVTHSR